MILRDLSCSICETVVMDVMMESVEQLTCLLLCDKCRNVTEHTAMCNGGMGVRFRHNDFPTDPAAYRGQVTVTSPTAHAIEDGKPVESVYGGVVHEQPKFTDSDRRNERQDRFRFERDKQKGRRPLYSGAAVRRSE